MNKITVMRTLKSIFILAVLACVCQASLAQTDKGIEYYNNKDYVNAVKCFRQAAEQGDTVAQHKLANCYYYGQGVAKDFQESVKWNRKAAEQGYAVAQNNLGNAYYNGEGVTKSATEAVK